MTSRARLPWLVPVGPCALLALSLVIVLATGGSAVIERWPTILTLCAVTLAYRIWWHLTTAPRGVRIAAFVINLVLTLALIWLHPLFGVYAFAGYLDAVVLFHGPGLAPALIAVASLNALAQSGGPDAVMRQPLIFAFLLPVNGVLANAMVNIDKRRQETLTRLQRTLQELEDARKINDLLQHQLIRQAREAGAQAERQRLAREIHDTVAQGLIALLRQIEAATEAPSLVEARHLLDKADHRVAFQRGLM